MKNKGQSVPREGKDMSNFNDLYDHVAADRTRAIQLLGIQDIRRKAIAEQRRDLCHGRRRHERAPQLHRPVHPDKA